MNSLGLMHAALMFIGGSGGGAVFFWRRCISNARILPFTLNRYSMTQERIEAVMVRNFIPSDEALETMGYRDLQALAKKHGISGKQSAAAIMSDLREARVGKRAGGQTKATPKAGGQAKATPRPKKVSLTALFDDKIEA